MPDEFNHCLFFDNLNEEESDKDETDDVFWLDKRIVSGFARGLRISAADKH